MSATQTEKYNLQVVQWFVIAAAIYLAIGVLSGALMSAQLAWPTIILDAPYLQFSRIKLLHINITIFAFAGCILMAAAYYSAQNTCGVRLWSSTLGWISFLGWNLIIIYALSKFNVSPFYASMEYAVLAQELNPVITLVWAAFVLNLVMTIARRKSNYIYISNWFFIGAIMLITYLYVINTFSISVSKPDINPSMLSGNIFDAIKKNYAVVSLYLTVGLLGVIYYFIPKQANRPIFSYRLSMLHFLGLMFVCVWIGMHQLQHTSLPDWFISLDSCVLLFTIIVSLIGAMNGIMTIAGSWNKLRTDYILSFLILSLVFYAIYSFDDHGISYKSVSALSQYTYSPAGSGHLGSLGWIVMAATGALYHMVEKLWKTRMYSNKLVNLHFWMAAIGSVVYFAALKAAAIMQATMWSTYDEHGDLTFTFTESVNALHPYYITRTVGGALYSAGILIMLYNIVMTIRKQGIE